MSDIIAEVEKAIEKAAIENSKMLKPQDNPLKMNQRDFIAGAQFILPLLKKAIEQRNIYIDLAETVIDKELLKLLGENHE